MLDIGPGLTTLGTSLITLVAALWAARMNINAAQSDRIWESRKQSYTSILAKLKDASFRADVVDRGYNSAEDGLGPEDYSASLEGRKEEEAAGKAWERCKSEFDVNHLIVSDELLARFESLLRSLPTEYDGYLPPRHAALWAECLREAYRDVLSLARREMLPA